MSKHILAITILLFIAMEIIVPIKNTPAYSANVTTSNVTLFSTDLEDIASTFEEFETQVEDMTNAIEDAKDAAEDAADIFEMVFQALLVIGVAFLAFYIKHILETASATDERLISMIVFLIAGFVIGFVGLMWVEYHLGLCICLLFFGLVMWFEALMLAMGDLKPAQGLKQFRNWWSKIRGRE